MILICTPGKDLPDLGSWTDLISLDKIIHVTIFGLMGYLFMRPFALNDLPSDYKKKTFSQTCHGIVFMGVNDRVYSTFFHTRPKFRCV